MRTAIFGLGIALAVAGSSGIAIAEEGDNHRLDDAWADLTVGQEPILTSAQFAALNNLAFQAAASQVCDGYEVDPAKFSKSLDETTATGPEGMTPDEAKAWESAVIFRLGASYGLFLAEGNANSGDFCDSAAEFRADATSNHIWK
jgi:hypothetical protein